MVKFFSIIFSKAGITETIDRLRRIDPLTAIIIKIYPPTVGFYLLLIFLQLTVPSIVLENASVSVECTRIRRPATLTNRVVSDPDSRIQYEFRVNLFF